jgi:hypothetical protein
MVASSIPKSFTLANRKWKVRFVPVEDIQARVNLRDGEVVDGCCDPRYAVILLSAELLKGPEEYLYHTFEHEVHHALFFALGLEDHDERIVEGLAGLRRQFEITRRGDL